MSRFRVLQFNMQFGQIWDEADPLRAPIDLGMTLAEIRRHNADIIFLQEVEHAQGGGIQLQPPPNYLHLRAELPGYGPVPVANRITSSAAPALFPPRALPRAGRVRSRVAFGFYRPLRPSARRRRD